MTQRNWNELKLTNEMFPKKSITLAREQFDSGETHFAWINSGYKNYPYKQFCTYLGILTVDFEDLKDYDYGEIQEYFEKELNKACVSHLVARVLTESKIEMLFYFENRDVILNKIENLYDREDKMVDFGCQIVNDPEWETVENLLSKYSKK